MIDLTTWWDGPDSERQALAEMVDATNRASGFLTVIGHRIPDHVINAMLEQSAAFFDLPEATKMATAPEDPRWSRGYRPLKSRALAYSTGAATPPDLVEYFAAGRPGIDFTDPYYAPDHAGVHFFPNLWPSEPSDFEAAWTNYYVHVEKLATELMRVFAVALGLPMDWFDASIDKHCSNLFANNYPAYDGPIEEGQLRLGAHTDYGSLTIVYQRGSEGGLQIHDGENWLDVPTVPGSFVVNIGDLMARWTNDRWHSTLHRVVNPDAGRSGGRRRMSIPFFHQPNYDALIECLPGCVEPGESPKYPPILSGVNMIEKTNATLL